MCFVGAVAFDEGDVALSLRKVARKGEHRSHKSAGMVTYDHSQAFPHLVRDLGMATTVFSPQAMEELQGSIGIVHLRWATAGTLERANVHPLTGKFQGKPFFLVHNGEISFRRALERRFADYQPTITSDTKLFVALIEHSGKETFEEAIRYALGIVKGTYSLIILYENTIYAARDVTENRPLYIGVKEGAVCIASETIVFRSLDIHPREAKEIKGGELVVVHGKDLSVEWKTFQGPLGIARTPRPCFIELVYSMHPASIVYGRTVYKIREELGFRLAQIWKPKADVVVGVPDSGVAAGKGFSRGSGIPYADGAIRYHQSGRIFYSDIDERRDMYDIKYDPVLEMLEGQRVVLVDDTMFASETMQAVVEIVLEAGAKEVHIAIPAPMIVNPCFYGTPTSSDHRRLIARDHKGDKDSILEEISTRFGTRVKSLEFLPLWDAKDAVVNTKPFVQRHEKLTTTNFCDACFLGGTRHIPVDVDGNP